MVLANGSAIEGSLKKDQSGVNRFVPVVLNAGPFRGSPDSFASRGPLREKLKLSGLNAATICGMTNALRGSQ